MNGQQTPKFTQRVMLWFLARNSEKSSKFVGAILVSLIGLYLFPDMSQETQDTFQKGFILILMGIGYAIKEAPKGEDPAKEKIMEQKMQTVRKKI